MKNIHLLLFVSTALLLVLQLSSCKKTNPEDEKHPCDTIAATYSGVVQPILQQNCYACHANGSSNAGVTLGSHPEVVATATNGRLSGAINHEEGYTPMPSRSPQLDSCTIFLIDKWIDDGMADD